MGSMEPKEWVLIMSLVNLAPPAQKLAPPAQKVQNSIRWGLYKCMQPVYMGRSNVGRYNV